MYAVLIVLIFGLLSGTNFALKNKFLTADEDEFKSSAAGQYGKHDITDHRSAPISNIAVFLLGTLMNAVQFGEEELNVGFYDRSVASRMTWARQAKIFYIVTGKGDAEERILNNKKYCRNATNHARELLHDVHTKILSFELYKCGTGREEIDVLHLPHCLGTYAGYAGPCCRCEGAILFYAALHKSHTSRNHPFPNWLAFSDDDYFVRLNYLESILNNTATPHDKEYALVPSSGFEIFETATKKTERPAMGLFQLGDCRSSCMFRVPWMSWGGFSIGAVRMLEKSLLEGGLVTTCQRWSVTHDIGLGLYSWMNSIQLIDIKMGKYNGYPPNGDGFENDAVLWHKAFGRGMRYDTLFENIWNQGNTSVNKQFNLAKYIEQETQNGLDYERVNHVYPNGGFKNTLFYRNLMFRDAILSQIQETQLGGKTIGSVLDYIPEYCTKDRDLFLDWKKKRNPGKEIDPKDEGHAPGNNIPKECFEYSKFVNNLPASLTDENLLPIDDLIR